MKMERIVMKEMKEAKKWRRRAKGMMAEKGVEWLRRKMVSDGGASSCARRAKTVVVWVSRSQEISAGSLFLKSNVRNGVEVHSKRKAK